MNTAANLKQKQSEREKLEADVQRYLDSGKMIEILSGPSAPPVLRGKPVPSTRFNPGA